MTDRQVDGWTNGWMGGCRDRRTDGGTKKPINEQTDGQMDGAGRQTDKQVGGRIRRMDVQIDGRTGGHTDG